MERRLGLIDAQLEIERVEPGHDVTAMNLSSEVHAELGQPAGDLHAQDHLLLRVERARHRDRTCHLQFRGGSDAHFARLDGRGRTLLR